MIAAAIEQNYDRAGIIWPREITPLNVIILPVNSKDRELMDATEKLESELLEMGMEILTDDRDLSPGVKFKDSELVGIPLRITVGNKLREGKVEILYRESMEVIEVPLEEASAVVNKYYSD